MLSLRPLLLAILPCVCPSRQLFRSSAVVYHCTYRYLEHRMNRLCLYDAVPWFQIVDDGPVRVQDSDI